MGKLALAMQEAHARGIVHRDLKPANIMIRSAGRRHEPVIVDFGLARRDDVNEVRLTRAGQIMGTLSYMAPEQIRDDPKAIGPACDIYALGVILHELLTGRLPFSGSGLAIASQILTQTPLPPSAYRPDIAPRLEAVCLKAMAKKVEDRYASTASLAWMCSRNSVAAWVRPRAQVRHPGHPRRAGGSPRLSGCSEKCRTDQASGLYPRR